MATSATLTTIASSRETILAIVLLLAIVIIFNRTFYSPKAEEIKKIKAEVTTLQKEQKTLKDQNKLLLTQQQKKQAQNLNSTDNTKLLILKGEIKPDIKDTTTLLSHITNMNSEHRLNMGSLSTTKISEGSGFTKAPFTLTTSGFFPQVLAFIEQMDNIPALVAVDAITLTNDPMIEGHMGLEMRATLYQLEDYNATNIPTQK
ncbi:MAG TPA: hypothetical protein DDW49_11255 [Deltaproteobacteria bacterium]|nr:hypothetical protein [Deltaproteobacteria bacterium]